MRGRTLFRFVTHRATLIIVLALACFALVPAFTREAETSSANVSATIEREDESAKRTRSTAKGFVPVTEEQRKAVQRGLEYLVAQQDPHKGFFRPLHEGQNGRVAITALACLSLMANGNVDGRGPMADAFSKGIRYLLRTSHQDNDAIRGFLSTPGDALSRMHGHGYAALALAEAYGMFGENPEARGGDFSGAQLRARLVDAIRLIERSQTTQGGWGYEPDRTGDHEGSITVCQLQALRSAKTAGLAVNLGTIRKATRYLHLSQELDGSFTYSLQERRSSYALTAAAVSTLHARGDYDTREVRRGMDYLLSKFDHFIENKPYFYYGGFYAAQAMYHSPDFRHFEKWFDAVRGELLRLQVPADGSWRALGEVENYGPTYCTAMATLILQVPYNYLPIFQR